MLSFFFIVVPHKAIQVKKIMLVFVLTAIALSSFSQSILTNERTKEYYLNKSRQQKRIAWILLGSGIVATVGGYGAAQAGAINSFWGGDTKKDNSPSVLLVAGIASTLGSIPLFISASNNKWKAADLAFGIQQVPMQSTGKNLTIAQPALTMKVSLK